MIEEVTESPVEIHKQGVRPNKNSDVSQLSLRRVGTFALTGKKNEPMEREVGKDQSSVSLSLCLTD